MKRNYENIVEIFADGACSGNPGPGGYGAILKSGDRIKEVSGCEKDTTNNRMELMAVIEAFKQLKKPCRLQVISDSSYVIKGMKEWLPGWIKKNWMNSRKEPVLNRDLWESLLKLSSSHQVEWIWIKGHNGHTENERCDELARKAIKKCS
jgi:ribonuclease HI